jgi:hypothetical protein
VAGERRVVAVMVIFSRTAPARCSGRIRQSRAAMRRLAFCAATTQNAIQIKGRADQCEMRECPREIAQCFALRSRLFGVESEMVGIAQHVRGQRPIPTSCYEKDTNVTCS